MMTSLLSLSFASAARSGPVDAFEWNSTSNPESADYMHPGVPAQGSPDGPGTAPPRAGAFLNFGTKYVVKSVEFTVPLQSMSVPRDDGPAPLNDGTKYVVKSVEFVVKFWS
jgi:hypothetical protein